MQHGDSRKPGEPEASWRLAVLLGVAALLVVIVLIPVDVRENLAAGVLPLLGWALLAAIVVALIAFGVRLGIGKQGPPANHTSPPPRAFPVVPAVPIKADGPGKFRICGVDRATKLDTVWHCPAESEANARAKGELEGILVTSVERVEEDRTREGCT